MLFKIKLYNINALIFISNLSISSIDTNPSGFPSSPVSSGRHFSFAILKDTCSLLSHWVQELAGDESDTSAF